jgi:tRNA(fMet)-specific endonuclease VapC
MGTQHVRRYLLDSGSFNDYIARRNPTHRRAQECFDRGDRLGICMPLLGEFLGGLLGSDSAEASLKGFRRVAPIFRVWPFDRAAAEEYAHIVHQLKSDGRPMGAIDMQIAAVARSLGRCVVVTKDSDFHAIRGIRIENWSQPEGT